MHIPLDLFLLGVLLASLQSGLEVLDHKRHLIFVEASRLNLCHLVIESLLVHQFEGEV
jgi:hypothetical protein